MSNIHRFNSWLANKITASIGTMACAYLFGIFGAIGMYGAFTDNTKLVLIVGAISGYFLQLVLLPIIMVGQKSNHDAIKKIHKHLKIKGDKS